MKILVKAMVVSLFATALIGCATTAENPTEESIPTVEETAVEATREDENAYIRMKALQFVGTGRQ